MTYYGRADNEHVDLHLALVVEGIPFAFVERNLSTTPTSYGGRTPIVCITRVEEGESTLDYEERRETASTLDIGMLDEGGALAALFAAGTRPVAWVSTSDANEAADTLIYTNTVAPFAEDDVVYIGSESMIIDTVDGGGPSIDVQRGAFGSTALDGITGQASDGDDIYTVPPFWRGRRAWLYGYAPDGAGLYTETLLGTYIVDESPVHGGDLQWSLRLASVIQEYWERSVGVGMRQTSIVDNPYPAEDITDDPWSVTVYLPDKLAVRAPASTFPAYVMITDIDEARGPSIHRLTSIDTLTGEMVIEHPAEFGTPQLSAMWRFVGASVRQIAVIQAPGAESILIALLSTQGQETSGSDYLPGRQPSSTYDAGWSLGAGFLAAEVDVNAFEAITAIPPMTIIIDGERKVTDLLREWAILTGTAIVSTVDGKIKPITLAAQRSSGARTIGAADVVPDGPVGVEHDESGVYPLVSVKAGYSPITGDFHDEINMIDVELAKRYRRTPQKREIELMSIDVDEPRLHGDDPGWTHPTKMTPGALVTMLSDTMRGEGALARRFVTLSLTHEHLDLRIGDLVTIGTDLPDAYDLPDFRGGAVAGSTCRVVSRRPRYDQARVDVRLEILDRLLFVCPSATIASVGTPGAGPNGGTVLTLSTTEPASSGATPSDDFWDGSFVTIIDRSSPGGSETLEVLSIPSTTTIEIEDPGFTPVAGDYIVLNPESSADGTTASGYTRAEFAKLADEAGDAGVVETINPRWR